MGDEFDPYYTWLGIPKREQPPTHYRLLGIDDYESSLEAIENAVERVTVLSKNSSCDKKACWTESA